MINVIFNPVNKMYKFTKVELYANDKNEKQYLGTYKSSEDMFRISIDNLSYGKYIVKSNSSLTMTVSANVEVVLLTSKKI